MKELIENLRAAGTGDPYYDALFSAAADALEAQQWRTDEPPKGKAVQVTIENPRGDRETETGNLHDDGEWYIYERGGILRSGTVVAWQEMPEPYKGE